ncbi:MAG: SH3 domain-containing protein [Sulfitobacter sp.]
MKRFILLSFGFLGWAFYEMSGGADFEPASVRMARLNPVAETAPVVVTESVTPAPTVVAETKPAFVDTDPPLDDTVTRVSLNLTTLQEVLSATDEAEPTGAATAQDDTGVPVNVGVTLASADTPAIIPSLIAPNDGAVSDNVDLLTTSASTDVRTVSANRVNVRGGPGTDYGVVTKLTRGDAVEILQDNGDGWVKMRTLDGGPEGWMADFLLVGG